MNKRLKDMLIGVILGDAHIGRTGLDKAFISFEQSKSKMNYLSYLQTLTKEGGLPLFDDSIKEYSSNKIKNFINLAGEKIQDIIIKLIHYILELNRLKF